VWHQPASGLRYDAFLIYAGTETQTLYQDGSNDLLPDPEFPMVAPLAWIVGDADVTLPQWNAYIYANQVARAFAALGNAGRVNDFLRIYSPEKLTHLVRDQLYANYDRLPSDDALWYAYADADPNPGAFNTRGHGLRLSSGMAQAMPWNGPADGWDEFFHGEARMARLTPLFVALLTDLRARSEVGVPLPVSRVHRDFFVDPGALASVQIPPYPLVDCPAADPVNGPTFAEAHACSKTLTTDSLIYQWPNLSPHEVDELQWFAATNPLGRSLEPLVVPDVAAPLGALLFYYDLVIENAFTNAQLATRYGTHAGYVDAFAGASGVLIGERLWDARLGALYVTEASQSAVLAGR
jgi:hypothetical protein